MQTENRKPEMIVIAGPNGSGKTSVTKKLLHHEWTEDTLYINPDEKTFLQNFVFFVDLIAILLIMC
jgi:uridine kinase